MTASAYRATEASTQWCCEGDARLFPIGCSWVINEEVSMLATTGFLVPATLSWAMTWWGATARFLISFGKTRPCWYYHNALELAALRRRSREFFVLVHRNLQLEIRLFCSSRRVEDRQRCRRMNNRVLLHRFYLFWNELLPLPHSYEH